MDEFTDRYLTHEHDRMLAHRDKIAQRLRDLADEAERKQPTQRLRTLDVSYGRMASDIMHAITWGFANLSLDSLVRDCADLDVMIARESKTTEEDEP